MGSVLLLLTGGFGALLSLFLSPFSAAEDAGLEWTAVVGACGFIAGVHLFVLWYFVKVRLVRLLLQYNGWFLRPKRPINMVWYVMVRALLGRRDKGSLQYEDYLPSYPLPSLKNTCSKYLQSVEPLVSEEEYASAKSKVEEFLKKDGPKLQFILRLRTLQHRNWLDDWWRDYIYYKQRTPIPFNSNYFATGGTCLPTSSQLDRAGMLLHSCTVFYLKMLKGQVENQRAQNLVPFGYNSFRYLCMSCRVPGVEIDTVVNHAADMPRHIVVIRQGKFYKFDIISKDGRVQTPLGMKRCLEKIVSIAGDQVDDRGVCSFTALPRSKWAQVRERLRESEVNRRTLCAIESSSFVLSLETDHVPHNDFQALADYMWHGRIHNRWYDKSINLCVCTGGTAGANIEHSMLDAMAPGQHWEYMMTDEEYDEGGHVIEPFRGQTSFDVEEPVHLQWDLEGMGGDLKDSKANLTRMIADSELVLMSTYGKEIPKKCKLSPDGWFQTYVASVSAGCVKAAKAIPMAIQLTHYRIHKHFVLTYESATTRFYYKGRTETIRPVSTKSAQFCKAFDDPQVAPEDVKKLLKESIELQTRFKMEAMRGLGVDRHLFGLYCVAKGTNMNPLPPIFTDKAFNLEFLLSTSQTPVRYTDRWRLETSAQFGGFGTVTDDGYGLGYLVYEDYVNWSIHSKRSSPRTDSRQFAENLKKIMEDMKNLYS